MIVFILVSSLLSLCSSLHQRDGITVATYSEALELWENDPDLKYLNEPMIITDSAMSEWTLFENLEKIFGAEYDIQVNKQTVECSCFSDSPIQYELCEQFASSFVYYRPNHRYKYWLNFESKHKESSKYMHCLHKIPDQTMFVSEAIQRVTDKDSNAHFYVDDIDSCTSANTSYEYDTGNVYLNTIDIETAPKTFVLSVTGAESQSVASFANISSAINTNGLHPEIAQNTQHHKRVSNYTKLYSYFNAFGMKSEEQMVTALQLNTLDQIHLSPYFDIFGMRGYLDVKDIHIWFGTEYYRAMRHFDKDDNLFFVIEGSRTFRVSAPTLEVFPLHPFGHSSNRQQYPYYPLLETDEMKEGAEIPDNYKIHEVELFANELFYLPAFWHHEVINNNFSVAMSVWWPSMDMNLQEQMNEFMLPINPQREDGMDIPQIDEFMYFVQILIDEFCDAVRQNDGYNSQILRCLDSEYRGYGYLTTSFRKIYSILDEITYDNFEWMGMIVDVENIIKCSRDRIYDYNYKDLTEFKNDLYLCWDIEDELKDFWDYASGEIVHMLLDFTHIGISELVLQEYLENILVSLSEDTNMVPIWLKMMNL